MALIKIELDYPLEDGMSLTFKAPCDCTAVTGLKVYYPEVTDNETTTTNKTFSFRDTHLNSLESLGNLFMSGATVKVVVDTTNAYAYIQNSDTNAYLESKITSKKEDIVLLASGWVDNTYTLNNEKITATNPIELLPSVGITDDQFKALSGATIIGDSQSNGSIVLLAKGTIPTIDIPCTFIFRGDL